ncbi:LytR/AlgR family response regulator transcription factor [Clostridium cellulovorans]|uniref:Stage 0 sporulation protein A homolog n=1 Tax=Clostridium cellulovorans (strain ATCC 35296 / DSM 3052 / OCM 3 / 743B) TaxID=573061 RepID=D9SU49_CLOC7|nr:LytTR family DNA-binding domain-containing protein [Clostridium cellulovorans]ADL50887.1 two component transcriptional regulator, LytTR family [Clostridium cellulovorans 743B]
MLKVIIVEDNEKQRKSITEIIENTIIREKLDAKIIVSTSKINEVTACIKEIEGNFIAFLDIDLKQNINGIKLGQYIREKWPNCFLVFITSHSEMSYLTFEYKLEALDFIIKDNVAQMRGRIEAVLMKAVERSVAKNHKQILSVETDEAMINIPFEEIVFFETATASHKIRIHAKDRQIEFYGTLSAVLEKLDSNFLRCHKSFVVNKSHIKEIDKINRRIFLDNGEECFVSFRYLREVIKSLV